MKILLFGGTTEGRILTEKLLSRGHELTVSVATAVGEEELTRSGLVRQSPNLTIRTGRMDRNEIAELLTGFSLCIDATHPYAVQISEILSECCTSQNIPLKRILRSEGKTEGCILTASAEEAARLLAEDPYKTGNILLTTGAKELSTFQNISSDRIYVRILPTQEGIAACEQLGLKHRQILAMQGPFTREFNESVIRQYHIRYLVTKDGGKAGGMEEKTAAAAACGARVILIRRPSTGMTSPGTSYMTIRELLTSLDVERGDGSCVSGDVERGDGSCVSGDVERGDGSGVSSETVVDFCESSETADIPCSSVPGPHEVTGITREMNASPCASTGITREMNARPCAPTGITREMNAKPGTSTGTTRERNVTLIGYGCGPEQMLPQAKEAICHADWVVGAPRLLENLPIEKERKKTAVRTEEILSFLLEKRKEKPDCHIAALFSGDTGFYSGATLLGRQLEQAKIPYRIIPGISSLQMFAARLKRPWQDWTLCSAHGRECDPIRELSKGKPVFLLTGSAEDSAGICARLAAAGLGDCWVTVGEALGTSQERIISGTAQQMQGAVSNPLHVMLLELPKAKLPVRRTPGIPDDQFIRETGENGKTPVPMTKQEVRAVILARLGITPEDICWDIGAGTGSVSIEMSLAGGRTYAVEYKKEALALLEKNRVKFNVWNLEIIQGKAPEALSSLPTPSVVFIGGSTGKMAEILTEVEKANPEARICVSAIALETIAQVLAWANEKSWTAEAVQIAVSRSRPASCCHIMTANNPVYLITLKRGVGSAVSQKAMNFKT